MRKPGLSLVPQRLLVLNPATLGVNVHVGLKIRGVTQLMHGTATPLVTRPDYHSEQVVWPVTWGWDGAHGFRWFQEL